MPVPISPIRATLYRMSEIITRIESGALRGSKRDGIVRFLGVPYAAPPVGARRFAPPQAPEPWSDVRDATRPGPSAPQRLRDFPALDVTPLVGDGGERGDDYLALNIWAPADATGRPVMVFVHGGAFVLGSKDAPVHDGSAFARDGVVMVAINYRLGVDGFLPIPGVPTNLGLRDIIAALHWVQANVAAFGGDPGNVTLFGESAGAMATASLVASPLAQGLFRRAIIQSGHGSMVREIPVAQRLVRKMAKLLRITPDEAGFRSVDPMTAASVIEKLAKPWSIDLRDARGFEPVFGISRFIPVFGDDVLPQHPLAALADGVGAGIDLLIGSNAQEMNLYFVPTGVRQKIPGWFARWLVGRSMPRARDALVAYGLGEHGRRPGQAMTDALTDLVFRWPARQFAAVHRGRTHVYELDWQSPACAGQLGAAHGMEMPFVFDTLPLVTGANGIAGETPPQALADDTHALWVDYATRGTLPWPAFDATRPVYQLEARRTISEPVMPAARFLP
jgi:para-nitrobenzyl esterase